MDFWEHLVAIRYLIKTSQYYDSVSLMSVAHHVRTLPGVEDFALVMGTEANKSLLAQAVPLTAEVQAASSTDLILMVKGEESVLDSALRAAEKRLSQRPGTVHGYERRPRTLRNAFRSCPDSSLAVVSVAGMYAAAEAWDALHQGLHVLLFSDNVTLDDEIALKHYAVEHGLLMMGPGAGTAILNGVALGFANVVPRGPVGIVSAAGTGLQEVSTLLAKQGVGLSQGIGVGGRDLSESVGGLMMLHAIDALQHDPATGVIVLISKLPAPAVADRVLAKLVAAGKPGVVIFMGAPASMQSAEHRVYVATTLHEAAWAAAALARGENPASVRPALAARRQTVRAQAESLAAGLDPSQRYLRGLFSGGTLCEEAMRLWHESLGGIWSNGPLEPRFQLPDSSQSQQHCALDLGEEEFTVGRPHPMIDNDLRIRRLFQEARDPDVAVIQMDVVLGYGAHPDPASELAPAIRQAREQADRELIVVTSITGTESDPQGYARQAAGLESAGALVMESNADASILAACIMERR
jgi:FdrA protein